MKAVLERVQLASPFESKSVTGGLHRTGLGVELVLTTGNGKLAVAVKPAPELTVTTSKLVTVDVLSLGDCGLSALADPVSAASEKFEKNIHFTFVLELESPKK